LLSTVDVLLDRVGEGFVNEAIGLVGRGIIAALDSLAAASGATALSNVAVIGGNTDLGYTITNSDGSSASTLLGPSVIGGNSGPGFTILDPNGMPVDSVLPAVAVIGGNTGPQMTITNPDGSPATTMDPNLGVIGGNPTQPFTFSVQPSYGAGSVDLRGIDISDVPVMPEPQGYVRGSGDLANRMAINIAINDFGHRTLANVEYDKYAAERQGIWHETPVPREDYHP
jgi:hypothetical protein